MSKFLRAVAILTTVVLGASASQAQTVGMAGEYSEGNGIIVQIPQNPPLVPCSYLIGGEARCQRNRQAIAAVQGPDVSAYPHHGVYGARFVDAVNATPNGVKAAGLNPGDAFTIPTLFMQQRLDNHVGIVLNAAVVQLDTQFTAAAPGASRAKNPPGGMRRFSQMNWSLAGQQDNGEGANTLSGVPLFAQRLNANTTVTRTVNALETLALTNTAGPNEFGGVMGVLLDGTGLLYLGPIAQISNAFPASWAPIVATNPVGNATPGFATRNAVGWDYTVMGVQAPGRIKAFGAGIAYAGVPATKIKTDVRAPACDPVIQPVSPVGCNEINGYEAFGATFGTFGAATSTKHMFAWTTGTVVIQRSAVRFNGNQIITDTVTGMGYDITGTDGGVDTRKVGMIAGSYTKRTDGTGAEVLNTQMVGMDLKFTPEPGATVALLSGLGMLGALATRRRR